MEIKHLTLAEADALGLPRVTYVIHSGAAARRFAPPPRPAMTATENECRYEWAYQALDDYLDAADCEDDDDDAAAYREEAIKWAEMLCALGLRFWRPDGSCYWLALRLYNRLADAAAAK